MPKRILNIWKLSGHADLFDLYNFYHSTFGAFDPELEGGPRKAIIFNLIIYLVPYFDDINSKKVSKNVVDSISSITSQDC